MADCDTGRLKFTVDPKVNPLYHKKAKTDEHSDENSKQVANGVEKKLWGPTFSASHQCGHRAFADDFIKDSEEYRPRSPSPTLSPTRERDEESQAIKEWIAANNDKNPDKEMDERLKRKRK